MAEIRVDEYVSMDRESCVELLGQVFPGTSNDSTFGWRFESALKHPPIIVCAKEQERVVSFNAWLPWEFVHNGKMYLGYQSGESATHPDYRRKGILEKVLRYADHVAKKHRVDFLFGFPSTMIYGTFYKAGYCPIGVFPYRVRLINPFLVRHKGKSHSYDCAPLAYTLFEHARIRVVDDNDYRQWRFASNPKTYETIQYKENNNAAVFVVRPTEYHNKRYHLRMKELVLLDCHFSSYNTEFVRNAFKHVDTYFSRTAWFMRTFINMHTDRGRAISPYFSLRPRSLRETLCIKPINVDIDRSAFFNYNNWDIMPHVVDDM